MGPWCWRPRDPSKKFNPADLKLLSGVAHQASIALDNARQYELLLAREQVERDLELAGQMQRSILPDQLPQFPGFEFFAHYAAAHEVGGDYYDFIPLPHERVAVALGDVVGKGISAAMLMAKLSSDVRFCLQTEEPSAALARLNELIYKHTNLTERFVTLLAAVLDPARSLATLVNAGHVLPLLYRRATGEVQEAISQEAAGLPLGVQKGQLYESCQVTLEPGDCLLLFTDGVCDAVNVHGRPFRVEGVLRVLAPASSRPQRAWAGSSSKRSTNTPPAAASTTTSPSFASAEPPNSGCMESWELSSALAWI